MRVTIVKGDNPMKKILTFSAALVLGVCAAAGIGRHNATFAHADPISDAEKVAELLTDAIGSSGYTKKTQIFLKTEAVEDIETHFHAGVPSLKRTTYYNAYETALLMGDYEGGFASINSGYKNSGDDAIHFNVKEGTTAANMFKAEQQIDGWTAKGQNVGKYYETLSTLTVVSDSAEWEHFDNNGYTTYKHVIHDFSVDSGSYNDPVLNSYQYFVAPMLLRDNYITYDSIWVTKAASFLSLRLYANKIDSGKSTVEPGENEVLIAEARVYTGLDFTPEAQWYLKGDFNEWGDTTPLEYVFDAYNPEQYSVSQAVEAGQGFKLFQPNDGEGVWKGIGNVEDGAKVWMDGDDNIVSKVDGTITVYWKPGTDSMWIGVSNDSEVTYVINTTCSWDVLSAGAVFAAWVWGGTYGEGSWLSANHVSGAGTNAVFSLKANITATNLKVVRLNPDASEPSWEYKWNESSNVNLVAGQLNYNATW